MGYDVAIKAHPLPSIRRFAPAATPSQQTGSVREGVYVTFTALSVTLVLTSHPETSAREALLVLLVASSGAVIAALVADVVSHLVVHDRFMTTSELRHALRASLGSLVTIVVPLTLLAAAGLGAWSVPAGLLASAVALLATLVAITALAIRRARVPWWQRALFLLTTAVAGLSVVLLQMSAHG